MSHVQMTPYQASWKDANERLNVKYFDSVSKAVAHRDEMIRQVTLHKKETVDTEMSGQKTLDAATGLELPQGVLYVSHCPAAPYQANWMNSERKQQTKCFDTIEKAVQHRNDMIQKISAQRKLGGEVELTSSDSYAIESMSLSQCTNSCSALGLDTRSWQAGTRSDLGHRPVDQTIDLWLPVQAKSTLVNCFPYRFFIRGEYAMDIACFPGQGTGAFVFSEQFMRDNKKNLYSGKCLYIAQGSAFDAPLLTWPHYAQRMLDRWNVELVVHKMDVEAGRVGEDRVSKLRSEMELRMQCTENSQREVVTQMLMQSLVLNRKYEWPNEPNGHVDRLVDGRRVQDKVAAAKSRVFVAKTTKKMHGKQIPYAEDDLDELVACTIHVGLRLLFVWEIPIVELKRLGVVSTQTTVGAVSLTLPIATSDGANKKLETQVFGSNVYTGNRYVANFLKVYPLPEEYCIPECMQDRDPRVCV
jgi:hypothetical protein